MAFGKLQMLPTNGKPVTSWRQRDEAFVNIVQGIRKEVEDLQIIIQKRQSKNETAEGFPPRSGGALRRFVIMPLPASFIQCLQKIETKEHMESIMQKVVNL